MAAIKKIFQTTYLGDECWGKMWETIKGGKQPFKYVDRLEIAFADIITDDPDEPYLTYRGVIEQRIPETIKEARAENPNIEIIGQTGWASGLGPLVEDETKAHSRLATFANSIIPFL